MTFHTKKTTKTLAVAKKTGTQKSGTVQKKLNETFQMANRDKIFAMI